MSPGRFQSTTEETPEDVVDAELLAARGADIRREFRVTELARLRDLIADSEETATLAARFYLVDGKVAAAGQVTATLQLTCQRCLRPMKVSIEDEFDIVVAATEVELSQLPESQDAVIADAARLNLAGFIEEQLLLARPLAPMHENLAECRPKPATPAAVKRSSAVAGAESVDKEQETQRPFAGLRDLLNRRE